MGEDVVGRAFSREHARNRRLVHADLLAMIEADELFGWDRRPHPLRLAITNLRTNPERFTTERDG